MRIKIEKVINSETKEFWSFNIFDLNVVFVSWNRSIKPKGKRKWATEKYWDKYGRSNPYMDNEPILPDSIKGEALAEAIKFINVMTWNEWKGIKI